MIGDPKLERLIVKASLEAGEYIRAHSFDYGELSWKKEDDPVTELDRKTELLIRRIFGNDYNFLGEEYGFEDNGSDTTIIIDPIDGTKSFINKEFRTSVSIAAQRGGDIIAGVVNDFMRGISYVGLDEVFYLVGGARFPFSAHRGIRSRIFVDNDLLGIYNNLDKKGFSTVSSTGSFALAMAQLAAGLTDGMISPPGKGNKWDVAAGYHLLRLTGHDISDYFGNPFDVDRADLGLVASDSSITEKLKEVLSAASNTSVRCVLREDNDIVKNKVLLLQRSKGVGYNKWCLPGGKVDFGEDLATALKREVKEETDLDIYNISPIGRIRNGTHTTEYFAADYRGSPRLNQESKAYVFDDAFKDYQFAFRDREILDEL